MRANRALSDLENGADSALPALAIRISIGFRLFKRRSVPPKDSHRGTGLDERCCDGATDAATATGHQRVRRMR
jgi:hypothetical protein